MHGIIRKIILVVLLVFSMGLFVVRNRALVMKYNPLSLYKCDIPVTYSVGTVDPKFGVSQEKFMAMMQEAEQKWESALGRDVFAMKTDGRVKVSLLFDSRQATIEDLKQIDADIFSGKQRIDQSLDNYESLAAQLEQKKSSFNSDSVKFEKAKGDYNDAVNQYQKDLNTYNQNVSYWNSQGGASGSDYDKITQQKKDLDQQFKDIKNQSTFFSLRMTKIC